MASIDTKLYIRASRPEEAASGAYFAPGEGLVGQCALEKRMLSVDELPADYVRIRSGIGQACPRSLLVVPVLFEGEAKGVAASPAPRLEADKMAELRGRKVLLVDDDAHNLFAVTSLLERFGVRVVPAHGARECFQLLESEPDVDLVLIDVMMPRN